MIRELLSNLNELILTLLILAILVSFFSSIRNFIKVQEVENFCENLMNSIELVKLSNNITLKLNSIPGYVEIRNGKLNFHANYHSCSRSLSIDSINASLNTSRNLIIEKVGDEVILKNG